MAGSRCLKGTEESTTRVDSSVPLMYHDLSDLGLIYLVKKRKTRFRILSHLRIQSWIFFLLKKRTLITNLVFSYRTVSYGSSFFHLRFMARALRAWAINRRGKNSLRNLQYGPRTRLVRVIYLLLLFSFMTSYHGEHRYRGEVILTRRRWRFFSTYWWFFTSRK